MSYIPNKLSVMETKASKKKSFKEIELETPEDANKIISANQIKCMACLDTKINRDGLVCGQCCEN